LSLVIHLTGAARLHVTTGNYAVVETCLVDCTSFELMRRLGIIQFLACDPHFAELGFVPLAA
jgi:predicted nucleic acid-binding protein